MLVIVLMGMFSCHGLRAQTEATNLTRTTFEYKESKNYSELTNLILKTEQHLTDTEKTLGSSNTNFAYLLNDLAGYYDDLGDYAQSATLDERSLAILEQLPGTDNEKLADAVDDLAWEYRSMDDYDRALPLFRRSIAMTEKLFGPKDYRIATTLTGMADIYREEGDYSQALPLCLKGLEIRRKALGSDHPDITDSLYTLAAVYRELGNYKKALTLCQQSAAIGERHLGPEHPMVADNLFLLGQIQCDLGNYSESSSAFHRALAIDEKISGLDHPDVLDCLRQLAVLFGKQHELDQSISTYVELFKRQRRYFVGQILASSDRDALRLVKKSFESAESFHSVCAEGSTDNLDNARMAGATELALNKALLEEVRAAQAAFEADPRTATKELREQYRSAQFEWEHLGQSGLPKTQLETKRRELQGELSQIESKLMEHVGLVAQAVRERNLTLNDIARNLPSQSVLVDFIQYRRYDFAARTNQWKEQRYAAYLTFPLINGSTNVVVERVDLGVAAPIDQAIAQFLKQFSAGYKDSPIAKTNLYMLSQLVYAPLARHLTNVSHLIVCPDGQLSRLPFELLSVGNKFLVEEKTISYVTSGREVVRLQSRAGVSPAHESLARSSAFTRPEPPEGGTPNTPDRRDALSYVKGKSLVMGNPDFDLDLSRSRREEALTKAESQQPKAKIEVSLVTSSPTRALSRSYRGMTFTPLPGSGVEATNVAKLLGSDAVLRLGPDAREAELKAVASPRVLHLATHGFFLSDQEFKHTNSFAWSSAFTRLGPPKGGTPNDWENPLIRCGIALAGANHTNWPVAFSSATNGAHGVTRPTIETEEDGLLTGLEASLLNLQGTELVILSACDSGTGEVKIGEGVMSLRRAFRIAGAESVLASHWPVNDKATSRLMTEFMRRWRAGEPRAQAWREAQLELLRSKDFFNPYFWSAFTLTGQWN
jgi:CHAT domain-containing protein